MGVIQIDLSEIVDHCLSRWGNDEYLNDFQDKVLSWVEQARVEEQQILLQLLKSFEYYTIKRVNLAFNALHTKFSIDYADALHKFQTNAYSNAIFLPVYKKDSTRTSSYDMHGCYKNANNLSKHCFKTDLSFVLENDFPINEIDNIIFIDDMIGTGSTMIKFLRETFNRFDDKCNLKSKRIFLIVLEACSHGVEALEHYSKENDINLILIFSQLHKKAFSNNYIFVTEELESTRKIIHELEMRINDNRKRNVMGYEESEALMSFYHNIPNNTLSVFWKDNDTVGWKPLFPRARHDNPFSKKMQLSDKHSIQKKSNYHSKTL